MRGSSKCPDFGVDIIVTIGCVNQEFWTLLDVIEEYWLLFIRNAFVSKTRSSTLRVLWLGRTTVIGLNYALLWSRELLRRNISYIIHKPILITFLSAFSSKSDLFSTTFISFNVKKCSFKFTHLWDFSDWAVTPCNLIVRCHWFGDPFCLHLQGIKYSKVENGRSIFRRNILHIYDTEQRHIAEH
jgi:hypothetical protein